ncbi:MAG: hypothetical protein FWC64_10155 [Treponema sp.]|nr:hypothetical protein [Treponema sp.]
MKNFIVFALLFGALTANAFAQLTFSGSLYAGVQMEIPHGNARDGSPQENTIYPHHRREGEPVFNLTATFNRPNAGARLDTSFQTDLSGGGEVILEGVYGWVDLTQGLRLTMGRISSPLWVVSLDPDHQWYFDKVTGFRLQYATPLPGLTVGAVFRTEGGSAQQLFERAMFGATYSHPMFNAVFAYNIGSNGHALFGFNYFGIPDLTAGIQLRAAHLASWDDPGFGGMVEVVQRLGYRLTHPMELTLLAGQIFYAQPRGDFARRDTELFFTPGISYRLRHDLTASFAVEFRSADFFDDSRLVTFNPALEYQLDGAISFYAEYELRLGKYVHESFHRISIGVNVRIF